MVISHFQRTQFHLHFAKKAMVYVKSRLVGDTALLFPVTTGWLQTTCSFSRVVLALHALYNPSSLPVVAWF